MRGIILPALVLAHLLGVLIYIAFGTSSIAWTNYFYIIMQAGYFTPSVFLLSGYKLAKWDKIYLGYWLLIMTVIVTWNIMCNYQDYWTIQHQSEFVLWSILGSIILLIIFSTINSNGHDVE